MATTQKIAIYRQVFQDFNSNFPSRFVNDSTTLKLYQEVLFKLNKLDNELLRAAQDVELEDLTQEIKDYNYFYNTLGHITDEGIFYEKLDRINSQVDKVLPTIFDRLTLNLQDLDEQMSLFRAEFELELERQKVLLNDERKHLRALFDEQSKDLQQRLKDLSERIFLEFNKSTTQGKEIEELNIKLRNEWEEFREKYKNIFATGEIYRQGDNFRINSESYFNLSKIWRLYIVGILIAILAVSIWFLFTCWDSVQCIIKYQNLKDNYFGVLFYANVISKILIKAFILTILIYILKFCINNYNALMHNSTISAHKHSSLFGALRIFEFIQDKELQEKFLVTASREIFTQHKTGYLRKEGNEISIGFIKRIIRLFKNSQ